MLPLWRSSHNAIPLATGGTSLDFIFLPIHLQRLFDTDAGFYIIDAKGVAFKYAKEGRRGQDERDH